ncbi:MAG: bifunctional DNA primase/polymerase [Eubacterium sp.]|jgi:predicted P-loop ATPase|nr:bifunctional DNA primase/polymerase [Eubacterium sp.]MCI2197819.1 bifunctional DNA primase/polymerase [Eubacterium sp.]
MTKITDAIKEYMRYGVPLTPTYPLEKRPMYGPEKEKAAHDFDEYNRRCRGDIEKRCIFACMGFPLEDGSIVIEIDLDRHNDEENGPESLRKFEEEHGFKFPDTLTMLTGGGGEGRFYKISPDTKYKNAVSVLPGVDVRGKGAGCIVPPSIHPQTGKEYQWELDPDREGETEIESAAPIAEANEAVYALLKLTQGKNTNSKAGSTEAEGFPEEYKVPDKFEKGSREWKFFQLASSLQAKGLTDEEIRAVCEELNESRTEGNPLDDNELDHAISSALKYEKGVSIIANAEALKLDMKETKQGRAIKKTATNYRKIMERDPVLAQKIKYDELACAPIYYGELPWRDPEDTMGLWKDSDDAYARAHITDTYGLDVPRLYDDAFSMITGKYHLNPISARLNALPEWDHEPRIKWLLPKFLGAEPTEYQANVLTLFMFGAIARAYFPGTKFDYCPILAGPQGIGKSTFFRKLALNDEWFGDSLPALDSQKLPEYLPGKWIMELPELSAIRKSSDVEAVKSFLSRQEDVYRVPYKKYPEHRKRRCVFGGTTNSLSFLTDVSGNRRFLPVKVGEEKPELSFFKDPEKVQQILEQAWAEALYKYKHNKPALILPKESVQEAARLQEEYREVDPYKELIINFLSRDKPEQITVQDLWECALGKGNYSDCKRSDSNRITAIMDNLPGWKRCKSHKKGKSGKRGVAWEREPEFDFSDF